MIKQFAGKMGRVAFVSSLLSFGVASSAQAILTTGISSFTGVTSSFDSNWTRGFRFQATQDLTVTALGVYDIDLDGLTLNGAITGVDVGLWSDSGTLLGQVLVPGGTTAPILDGFRYENLSSNIDLTTGSFYRVAADMSDITVSSGGDYVDGATPSAVNGITPIQSYVDRSSGGLDFPQSTEDLPGEVQLGGNIIFDDGSASVPFEFSPAMGLLVVVSCIVAVRVKRLLIKHVGW